MQACLWTGACLVGGCEEKCTVNEDLTQSWDVLLDRAMGPESYEACPYLAFQINLIISVSKSSGRRRLQGLSVRPRQSSAVLLHIPRRNVFVLPRRNVFVLPIPVHTSVDNLVWHKLRAGSLTSSGLSRLLVLLG